MAVIIALVRIGISGLAVGNPAGLGRLNRSCITALANAEPSWEIHVYFRKQSDFELLAEGEGYRATAPANIVPHFPPLPVPALPGVNRLLLEEIDLPRQFGKLALDAYLGCEFTLPSRPVAKREAVILPDMLPYTQPRTVSWRARWLYRRGIQRSIQRHAVIACISQHTLTAFQCHFPAYEGETTVVYPALSPRLMHLAASSRTSNLALQVQGSLHTVISPGSFLLSVGVLGLRKNTGLLISTYRRLVLDGEYNGSLILAGGDGRNHTAPTEPQLALQHVQPTKGSSSDPTPYIYDIGRVSDHDLSQLYRDADMLINLSSEEGFGYPVLEALSHGTPAVVTANTSMIEIAGAGIATTTLTPDECYARVVSALGALPLLQREAACVDTSRYSSQRLGADLAALLAGNQPSVYETNHETPTSPEASDATETIESKE